MALDSTEVRVAADGHIYIADVGATPPADVTTAISTTTFTDLGYASEDGVSITPGMKADDVNAWQSVVPVRRIVTGSSLEIKFRLIQSNPTTMGLYFNATVAGDSLQLPVAPAPLEKALLVEWIDGGETYRLYVGRASLSDLGDAKLARGDALGWEMTWTALPPATGTTLATVLMPAAA